MRISDIENMTAVPTMFPISVTIYVVPNQAVSDVGQYLDPEFASVPYQLIQKDSFTCFDTCRHL